MWACAVEALFTYSVGTSTRAVPSYVCLDRDHEGSSKLSLTDGGEVLGEGGGMSGAVLDIQGREGEVE